MTAPAVPLYTYQQRWLADRSRLKLARWSRQVGKTFTVALEIVDDIYSARAVSRSSPWLIMSRGERQAREAMRAHIQTHARAYGMALATRLDVEVVIDGERHKADEWDAGAGNIVTALPANPDTARGYTRNIWLDEFAIHREDREIWAAIFPSITRSERRAIVTSTPKGKRGKFYELATAADGAWSTHVVTIHDAVADGYPADIDGLRAGLADDLLWRQEYECEWLDEASAWLPYELIDGCENSAAGQPAGYGGGVTVIGVDIGIRRDLWAAAVLELVGDVAWLRELSVMQGGTFAARDAELDRLVGHYRPLAVAIDQTGMGEPVVEAAQRRYRGLGRRVEGVLFTAQRKLALATVLKERMQDRRLRLPAGDAALRADLHAISQVAGVTGAPRLVADGDTDGHADRFWALALATGALADGAQPAAGVTVGEDVVKQAFLPRRLAGRRQAA